MNPKPVLTIGLNGKEVRGYNLEETTIYNLGADNSGPLIDQIEARGPDGYFHKIPFAKILKVQDSKQIGAVLPEGDYRTPILSKSLQEYHTLELGDQIILSENPSALPPEQEVTKEPEIDGYALFAELARKVGIDPLKDPRYPNGL